MSRRRNSPWKKKIRRYVAIVDQLTLHIPTIERPIHFKSHLIGNCYRRTDLIIYRNLSFKLKTNSQRCITIFITPHKHSLNALMMTRQRKIWSRNQLNLPSFPWSRSKSNLKSIHPSLDNYYRILMNILKFSTGEKIRKGWLAEKVDRTQIKQNL